MSSSGYVFGSEAPPICPTRDRRFYIQRMRAGLADRWVPDIDDDIPLRCEVCRSISGSDFLRLVKARMPVVLSAADATVFFNTGKPITRTQILGKGTFSTGGIHELHFQFVHFDEVQKREFESLLAHEQVVLAGVR